MALMLALVASLLVGISAQETESTVKALRARAQERMRQDLAIFSRDDLQKLEALYQSANKNLSGPDAKKILHRVCGAGPDG